MRLLDTEVKYIDSDAKGIPKLTNAWGCLVDFLDATLVNGSEIQEVFSIATSEDTLYPELYWKATITLLEGHSFKENLSVIEISESSNPIYNGQFRVQEVTPTTIDIAFLKALVPIKPLALEQTLGVKLKYAPLGYQKTFEAPQKAVYKVTTKDDKYCYLRVDNSCPVGHDPAWAKFGRVSMFSDMNGIDDYQYRLGRYKAPAYGDNYSKNEESIENVWLTTRYNNSSSYYFYHKRPPNVGDRYNTIVGDSETFYLHLNGLHFNSEEAYTQDETYTFGRYLKSVFKEDPLPFLLRTTEKIEDSYLFSHSSYATFIRGRQPLNNHTFSTDAIKLYETQASHKYDLFIGNSLWTTHDTGINFIPYKNELKINLLSIQLRMLRQNNKVLEGIYRGTYLIANNIEDTLYLFPLAYKPFKQDKGSYYVRLKARDNHNKAEASFLISLNNWG